MLIEFPINNWFKVTKEEIDNASYSGSRFTIGNNSYLVFGKDKCKKAIEGLKHNKYLKKINYYEFLNPIGSELRVSFRSDISVSDIYAVDGSCKGFAVYKEIYFDTLILVNANESGVIVKSSNNKEYFLKWKYVECNNSVLSEVISIERGRKFLIDFLASKPKYWNNDYANMNKKVLKFYNIAAVGRLNNKFVFLFEKNNSYHLETFSKDTFDLVEKNMMVIQTKVNEKKEEIKKYNKCLKKVIKLKTKYGAVFDTAVMRMNY